MGSMKILCIALLGFAIVQAQSGITESTGTTSSTESAPVSSDDIANQLKKLNEFTTKRVQGVVDAFYQGVAKVRQGLSDLKAQGVATTNKFTTKIKNGAIELKKEASGLLQEISSAMKSFFSVFRERGNRFNNTNPEEMRILI
ncbi:uncharacterized protein [Venturia canescens]|uniref:uncharacterized protein n=1 Tax=Venturia canescens TaxID=32260 RepID=UPI001C9C7FD5|nr:uncharacterized protein LOC122409498 [Venturia canescens]XP_043273054.1 uncharacterized protein LOC122409498 [Venturia canescens]XP_043273055.1 uncharacterized protein LOC122409498 [Venturia canescens]